MLLLSQAAKENVPLIFTSVAAVSVWTPAWCVMASSTVPTVQMRVWDALNVTAPVHQLLTVISNVSAPQTDRSVHNKCVLIVGTQHTRFPSICIFMCTKLHLVTCKITLSVTFSELLLCSRFQTTVKCYVLSGY